MKTVNRFYFLPVNPSAIPVIRFMSGRRCAAVMNAEHFHGASWKKLRREGWRIAKVHVVEH